MEWKKNSIAGLKILGFFGFGSAILYLVFRSNQKKYLESCLAEGNAVADCSLLDKIVVDFQNADYWWLLVVVLIYMLSNVSRALRWGMLFEPLGHKVSFVNTFFSTMLMYLTNLFIPRAGEVVRVTSISTTEKVEFEKAMGTIVVDRLMDFVCFGIIVVLALIFEFQLITPYIKGFVNGLMDKTFLLVGLLAGLALFIWLIRANRQKLKNSRVYKKIEDFLKGFAEGLATVKSLKRPRRFIFHTINIWLCYYLMTYICFYAFAPTAHLGWQEGLVVFLLGAIGMIVPSPGGMGSYHLMLQTGLVLYGVNEFEGFSYANLLFFTVNIFGNIIFGLIAVIVLPLYNKNYSPVEFDSQENLETQGSR